VGAGGSSTGGGGAGGVELTPPPPPPHPDKVRAKTKELQIAIFLSTGRDTTMANPLEAVRHIITGTFR
jgi:hypothetical protein